MNEFVFSNTESRMIMKLLVCLVVIANISLNGNASIESFPSTSSNIALEDITKFTDKSCYRPCKFTVKPKRCHYTFRMEPSILDDGRPGLTINGITPGPMINACVNDIIIVDVENKIPDQDLAIHWHGVDQKGSPYMDGVPMVTQCPITYGATFRYAFVVSSPGTFFYHADSVSHQSDGVYGSLVVNQPQPLEPHSSLYDYDRSKENSLLIAAKFPVLMTGNLEDMSRVAPQALMINGDEQNTKLFVMQGYSYRLRLINAIAIECPIIMSIDRHEVIAIATDGRPAKPVAARDLKLYPGERMDVVVRASQESGGYWVRVQGTGACAALKTSAMLLYSGFNYTSMLQKTKNENRGDIILDTVALTGQMMESLQDVTYSSEPKGVYLGIDKNMVKYKEDDIDFRYVSDSIPKKPYLPAFLALKEKGIVQINGKNILYPNAPILLRPEDVVTNELCNVGEEAEQVETQCVQILNAIEGEPLELALVNEGFGSNDSYTFHMHGNGMQVVASRQGDDGLPLSKNRFMKLDQEKKIARNIQNPPTKDTVTVPNKGYTIVRIRPQRGSWLLECRSCGLSSLPAAIIIQVQQALPKALIDALPKCGNYRPRDVLLN